MDELEFIFALGMNFTIFGFIWGMIMLVVRGLSDPKRQRGEGFTYIFRIIKYFLLVSVTANFISIYANNFHLTGQQKLFISSLVLGLYLLGKFQNRAMIGQFAQNPMLARLMPKVDPKVELFLLIGSIGYFVACMFNPTMVDNGVINWFVNSIMGIYDTPIIGGIFKIITFFVLLSIFFRGINVIMRLLSGKPLNQPPNVESNFTFNSTGTFFEDEKEQDVDEDGFTDYEDVTDEENSDKD